ncbi:unnamed protein product [Schistosoma curassoni]|uniref:Uncharacterized protein n=1 Tax=Schistosoma curassoni TaxID=6186 RepID=A0A183K5S1_9TREM|nr:unnamed protein product [Schistosoma curassoni]
MATHVISDFYCQCSLKHLSNIHNYQQTFSYLLRKNVSLYNTTTTTTTTTNNNNNNNNNNNRNRNMQ